MPARMHDALHKITRGMSSGQARAGRREDTKAFRVGQVGVRQCRKNCLLATALASSDGVFDLATSSAASSFSALARYTSMYTSKILLDAGLGEASSGPWWQD